MGRCQAALVLTEVMKGAESTPWITLDAERPREGGLVAHGPMGGLWDETLDATKMGGRKSGEF